MPFDDLHPVLLLPQSDHFFYQFSFLFCNIVAYTTAVSVSVAWQSESTYEYIYILLFGFPSHLGHHRALTRDPCTISQVLTVKYLLVRYVLF